MANLKSLVILCRQDLGDGDESIISVGERVFSYEMLYMLKGVLVFGGRFEL